MRESLWDAKTWQQSIFPMDCKLSNCRAGMRQIDVWNVQHVTSVTPASPGNPVWHQKPNWKWRLLKNDLGYSSELLLPRWSAQQEHIFGTQTYSSVPQAEHKLMIWHMQNCNILMRILQVTENSPNNEGGVIGKCFSENIALAAKGYQN